MESTNELRREPIDVREQPTQEENEGLSIMDIVKMIFKHWIVLVAAIVLGGTAAFIYAKAIKKPVWQATGQMYVIVQPSDSASSTSQDSLTTTTLNLSVALLPSAVSFINSEPVMKAATEKYNADTSLPTYTIISFEKAASAEAANYTSTVKSIYINISAKSSNKDQSVAMVNALMDATLEKAEEGDYQDIFGNKLKVASRPGKTENNEYSGVSDSSMSTVTILLLGLAIGLVVGVAYGIIFELANTHVVSSKEIEQMTGVKVIGNIPDLTPETEERARKGHKGGHL